MFEYLYFVEVWGKDKVKVLDLVLDQDFAIVCVRERKKRDYSSG